MHSLCRTLATSVWEKRMTTDKKIIVDYIILDCNNDYYNYYTEIIIIILIYVCVCYNLHSSPSKCRNS